jgi:long-chain acyl-CoA synthetase
MNIFDALDKYSQNIAIVTKSSKISYNELLETGDRIGEQIKTRCLVFLLSSNNIEAIAGYLGFMRVKAVPVLINDTIDKKYLLNLLEKYQPDFIYGPSSIFQLNSKFSAIYSYNDYLLLKTDFNLGYSLHPDLAQLLTTSGSTGSPKFVRQSYKNIFSNAKSISQYLGITSVDRPITTMPMSYSYGLSIINSHLLKGASFILTDATLMDRRFWAEMRQHAATTFGGVPYIFDILKKLRFERMNLPNLKYITQAGGKLSNELTTTFADICKDKGIEFYVMYGQTEATSRMSYLPWKFAQSKAGSIGSAIPGGKFWLEDENNNVIESSNTVGELVYQGDNVAMGYAESCFDLQNGDDNLGILRTGDLAMRDKDEFYYITGRLKRFLKMYGNRVNLDEVESIIRLAGYESVCGGTDDSLIIYVTDMCDKDRIVSHIAERTGINRAGIYVTLIDKIPRTESGKVRYSALSKK